MCERCVSLHEVLASERACERPLLLSQLWGAISRCKDVSHLVLLLLDARCLALLVRLLSMDEDVVLSFHLSDRKMP